MASCMKLMVVITRLVWIVLRAVLILVRVMVLLVVAVAFVVSSSVIIQEAIAIIASVGVRSLLFFRSVRILGVAIVLVLMGLRSLIVVVLPWRSLVLTSWIEGHCSD